MLKGLISALAALALAGLCVQSAAAQTVRDHRTGSEGVRDHRGEPPPPPQGPSVRDHRGPGGNARFIVVAVSLHADDETGPDLAGSDEIMAQFHDRVRDRRVQTAPFSDFDTGETRTFTGAQMCIAPIDETRPGGPWRCQPAGAAAPMLFHIKLIEVDDWSNIACAVGSLALPGNGCYGDLVGERSITLARENLLAELPRVGDWKNKTVRLGGYTLTYRVVRVADAADAAEPDPRRRLDRFNGGGDRR